MTEEELRNKVVEFLKKQYTQKKIAEKSGISITTLNRFMNGKYKPGSKFLNAISKAVDEA